MFSVYATETRDIMTKCKFLKYITDLIHRSCSNNDDDDDDDDDDDNNAAFPYCTLYCANYTL